MVHVEEPSQAWRMSACQAAKRECEGSASAGSKRPKLPVEIPDYMWDIINGRGKQNSKRMRSLICGLANRYRREIEGQLSQIKNDTNKLTRLSPVRASGWLRETTLDTFLELDMDSCQATFPTAESGW